MTSNATTNYVTVSSAQRPTPITIPAGGSATGNNVVYPGQFQQPQFVFSPQAFTPTATGAQQQAQQQQYVIVQSSDGNASGVPMLISGGGAAAAMPQAYTPSSARSGMDMHRALATEDIKRDRRNEQSRQSRVRRREREEALKMKGALVMREAQEWRVRCTSANDELQRAQQMIRQLESQVNSLRDKLGMSPAKASDPLNCPDMSEVQISEASMLQASAMLPLSAESPAAKRPALSTPSSYSGMSTPGSARA